VLYGTHIYPWKKDWDAHVAIVSDHFPVYVGEVGCNVDPKQEDPATWAPRVLDYIEQHQWSWTAWCFHTQASPRLLQDWSYRPTAHWGVYVKRALTEEPKARSAVDMLLPVGLGTKAHPFSIQ
jgi:endoglucanase